VQAVREPSTTGVADDQRCRIPDHLAERFAAVKDLLIVAATRRCPASSGSTSMVTLLMTVGPAAARPQPLGGEGAAAAFT